MIAAATLALAAVTMSACTDAQGKPNLFGIPLPIISSSSGNESMERQKRQLELFDSTVRNPSADISPEIRVSAAEELIAMDIPEAIERLSLALRSDEPVVVTAVIDAMEASPEPVADLLPAAAETLTDATVEQVEKLSLILPRYGEEALVLVSAAARDRNEPPARRVGPIQALASFRSREAAIRLMALLQEQEPQPPEIIAATGASLEKLTGLPYGADADQWRKWWEKLKNEPIENWLRVMVLHLSTRTAELERESHHKTRENEEIALRLIEALRELFLSLTTDEQIERLPALLGDDLPYVREFALGRVELRLRDSVRIPDAVQDELAERLTDVNERPSSRLLAGRLLNELNYQGTSYLVAEALLSEKTAVVAGGYLEILAKRPAPAALDPALLWINDSTAGDAAASALWTMIVGEMIVSDDKTVRRSVRQALQWRTTPQLIRVLGAIGDDDDRARVEELLDGKDQLLRRAAAEGLAQARRIDPLLRRASDTIIYPFVLRLLADGPAEVDTMRGLAALAPPDEHRQEWTQTLKATADTLRATDLLATDDALSSYAHVDRALRADVLARVPGLPSDAISIDHRTELLVRLARLRIDLGEYQGAYEALAWPIGAPTTTALLEIKFLATVLSGRYDEAAAINDDVMAWLELLDVLIERHSPAAATVEAEIGHRFPNELQFDAGEVFRAAQQRLNQITGSAGVDTGSPG